MRELVLRYAGPTGAAVVMTGAAHFMFDLRTQTMWGVFTVCFVAALGVAWLVGRRAGRGQ